ncbi:hypothetical protein HOO65_090223 [Ceratocystis lukuohia]|uniref:Uncharacterized protein n=1 Tax=Ceratocystis lukuohia TaxID=2019550 RepID=A0ABR4M9L2_9PEZI
MRLFGTSLPFVLSFLSLAQATILEDHGYRKVSAGDIDGVLFLNPNGDYELIDVISFHPFMKMAKIFIAYNGKEPGHQNKLGLGDIYTALAEERKRKPEDIDWIVSEVEDDSEMEDFILDIRNGRNVGPTDEVMIIPGEKEWDSILKTKHYKYASLVNRKELEKIIVRTHYRTIYKTTYEVNSFHFYFPSSEYRDPHGEAPGSTIATQKDDELKWEEVWKKEWMKNLEIGGEVGWTIHWGSEEQEAAAYRTIYAEEERQEVSSMVGMLDQVKQLDSPENHGGDGAPVSRI